MGIKKAKIKGKLTHDGVTIKKDEGLGIKGGKVIIKKRDGNRRG